jgi:Ca2+/H+ antiporter, TMEM165/GDT1 family
MQIITKNRWYIIPPIILAALTAFSFLTMILWNALLPEIFHFPRITFWQAAGLLVLSRLLFSGGPWHHARPHSWKNNLREKWEKMTPEERDKFRSKLHGHMHPWGDYCGYPKSREKKEDTSA